MLVEKLCKYCNAKFSFEYVAQGKGSGNKLKRPYCSDECRQAQRKKMGRVNLPSRITKECKICNKEFFVPKCLVHRELCSPKCRRIHVGNVLRKNPMLELTCAMCHNVFKTQKIERKYCSPACFSASQVDQHDVTCEMCKKIFSVRSGITPRFCNKNCTNIAQSRGLVLSHVNGRSGYRLDIKDSPYFKSSFEADYYRYCVQCLHIMPLYEQQTFSVDVKGVTRQYTPDFWFPAENKFVELKGVPPGSSLFSQLLNSNTAARDVLQTTMGVNIDVIYMQDFYCDLKRLGLYSTITNLENRDYAGTKYLIRKHSEN